MEVVDQASPVTDETLLDGARAGDRDAFGALYERHFHGLYDFALRTVRDRELAADVVQTTFVKAWTACRKNSEIRNVKPWLYTIARNAAIDELRARKPLEPVEDMSVFAEVDGSRLSNPQAVLDDRELAELVWASAAALSPEDYSLLHMHLMQDLSADELAEQLDLRKGAVYTRVSRLKDSLEEAVAVTLLMRRARRDCSELDAILVELHAGDTPTREIRAAVSVHSKDCERCAERRRALVSPVEILGALAPVPASPGLLEEIWNRVTATLDEAGAVVPTVRRRSLRRYLTVGVLAGLLAAAAASAVVVASRDGGGVRVEDPLDVHSTSHRVDVPSRDRFIAMDWTKPRDAVGYSIAWTRRAKGLPDLTVEPAAADTRVRSSRLVPGLWWFHLRTKARNGRWTSTVDAGPYLIVAAPEPDEGQPPATTVATPKPAQKPVATAPEPAPPAPPTKTETRETEPMSKAQPKPKAKPKPKPEPKPKPKPKPKAKPKPQPKRHALTVSLAGTGGGDVTSAPAGIDCGTTCSTAYEQDTVVTLTASASADSTFERWSGDCSGTGPCRLTMRRAAAVTATFVRKRHTLTVTLTGDGAGTVTSDPAGVNCGAACSAEYDQGTVVTLTAAADPQSQFTGWSGPCSGTGACTVTLVEAARVTAQFVTVRRH